MHEAWDEPDSSHPEGRNTTDSLHSHGLEAIISVSEDIPSLSTIESLDYVSDDSLLMELTSLAICVGFKFVRLNSDDTLSVAVEQCFDDRTR